MGTCFVVMGFGKKTDFESGRTLDLDKSYRNVIKPAVEAAGFTCVRADEIVHSGLIDVPMYAQLQTADIVIADLSTSNKNAFYELGVRHALRPYTTIVIAEDGMKTPFDVNHVVIRSYKHLGEDIGFDEVMRFRKLLVDAIAAISAQPVNERVDSPVYRFVTGLAPPDIGARETTPQARAAPPEAAAAPELTHSALMAQVDAAVERQDFIAAKTLLAAVRAMMKAAQPPDRPEDPFIVQRLALLTYKSEHPTPVASLVEARNLLGELDPATSNDTETLGLWGAVHKRSWSITADPKDLDQAVRGYGRGFFLRNDYYNGINLAFLLNLRAAHAADPAEAIADFVLARRVRKEVAAICTTWLATHPGADVAHASTEGARQDAQTRYWVKATLAEAMMGLGDPAADAQLEATYASAPASWMADSTRKQIADLASLLRRSPLDRIATQG